MTTNTTEERSRASLDPPAEIVVPSTPIASRNSLSPSPNMRETDQNAAVSEKGSFMSPPPPASSSEMTPPPSSRHALSAATPPRRSRSESNSFLASPPATIDQTLCVAYGASENLPTSQDIDLADHPKLRKMAKDLLVSAQDFRMSAAHFKLQHSLLSLTSSEAVKRAEVEQQLARREVEILQSEEYRSRHRLGAPISHQPATNDELERAQQRIRELEQTNATLERRLRRAKKLIEEETDKNELLMEENGRLKQRIRDNREHFTRMMDNGSLASSPQTEFCTPQRKSFTRYPDSARSHISRVNNQDPFAALLAADQVLSGENASVPSTPLRDRAQKQHHHHGHSRGTHSMSSLPVTPSRSRHSEDHQHFFTPINKRTSESRLRHLTPYSQAEADEERHRHDRDSTISDDEAVTDEDVPASQASSLATSMLRRYPGSSSQEEVPVPANIGKSSSILQTKLFGQVKKAGVDRRPPESLKRKSGYTEKDLPLKKMRASEGIGLGIEH